MKIFLLVAVLCSNIFKSHAQQSVLDTSFNHSGKLFTNIAGMLTSCLVQPDGKILIGGTGRVNNSSRFVIGRLLSNGNYDNSFGTNGILYDSFYNSLSDDLNYLLLQPDGKIIAIGTSDSFINLNAVIARYLPNGALDNTFGNNGKLKFSEANFGTINSAALQPDGKIVLAGKHGGFILLRLQTNGLFDSTFGTYGKVLTNIGTLPYSGANAVMVQSDGKIVAGGSSYHNTFYWAAIMRYLANGTLDNTFGTNGVVETSVRGYYDVINSVVQQPDGKIIATGNSTINGSGGATTAFLLMRYDSLGNLDNSFNGNGKLIKNLGNRDDKCYKAILQTDGKIVVGGYTTNANINLDFAMYRANSDGTDDYNFGSGGVVTGNFIFNSSNFNDHGQMIAMQPDGKLIIAGYSALSGAGSFAFIRFTNQINVGVANLEADEQQLMVYPNPTTNQLIVIGHQFSLKTIETQNVVGQIVHCKLLFDNSTDNCHMNTENLTSGIYFLKATDDKGIQHTVKFVKE